MADEPVKASTSCGPRWSVRSPALPHTSWKAPSGRSPLATTICAMRQASIAVGVPGFSTTGIPARSAQAIFSAMFQAGKLKALTWTATPSRGTRMCWPQ